MIDIPRLALSIMQPWAWLIANGWKTIENRTWQTHNPGLKFRGPVAIHAGKHFDADALADLSEGLHPVTGERLSRLTRGTVPATMTDMFNGRFNGGIVGVAEIVDVVTDSDDEWFVGKYGLVIASARPIEFIPAAGALGFFDWRETERKACERRAAKEATAQ